MIAHVGTKAFCAIANKLPIFAGVFYANRVLQINDADLTSLFFVSAEKILYLSITLQGKKLFVTETERFCLSLTPSQPQ